MTIFKFFKSGKHAEDKSNGAWIRLTPKQDRFAMLIANGHNQSEAYRETYKAKDMGDATVHREAARLTHNPKVADRINELKKVASKDASAIVQIQDAFKGRLSAIEQRISFIEKKITGLVGTEYEVHDMLTDIYEVLTNPETQPKSDDDGTYALRPRGYELTENLTPEEVEEAEPEDKKYRVFDGNGMHLVVYPSGKKSWGLTYPHEPKKPRSITLGHFPDIDLDTARSRKEEALDYFIQGNDPIELARAWKKGKGDHIRKRVEKEKPLFISRNQPVEDVPAPTNSSKKQQDQATRWGAGTRREVAEIVKEVAKKAPEKKPEKKEKRRAGRDSDYSHLASLRYSDLENGLMGRLCLALVKSCGADKRYAGERFRLQASQSLDLFRDDKSIGQIRMMQPRHFEKTGDVRLLTYMGIASRLCKAILLLGTQKERTWLVDVDTDGQPRSLKERRLKR